VDHVLVLNGKKTTMYGHNNTLLGVQQRGQREHMPRRQNADDYRSFAAVAYWSVTQFGALLSIDPNNIAGEGEL
jgi:hypothetical protein